MPNFKTDQVPPKLKRRAADSHKGTFGRALIVGGSRGMAGAPSLSGIAALKSGAGLVTVAVPDRCLETVAANCMCYMTVPLADDEFGRLSSKAEAKLIELSQAATSIGIGPGLSRGDEVTDLVTKLYVQYAGTMIVDADALNALASRADGIPTAGGPRILTPHVGEFRRLANDENLSSDACRQRAVEYAAKHRVTVVLKGPRTLVTDGATHFENSTGNAGMATAGSGDVLTGVITALAGQGYDPFDAAALGVYVHGMAGDLACAVHGEISLTADVIAEFLSSAFQTDA